MRFNARQDVSVRKRHCCFKYADIYPANFYLLMIYKLELQSEITFHRVSFIFPLCAKYFVSFQSVSSFFFFHHASLSTITNTGSLLSEKTRATLVPGIRCTVKPSVTAKPESYELGNNLIKSETRVGSTVRSDKSA